MKAYHIYLLRHGETLVNKEGRYIGRTDSPLSAEGEQQLREMQRLHRYPAAEAFYSSPMQRCVQSLEILYPQEKPAIVPGLAECDFGDFEGRTIDELKDDAAYREWIAKEGRVAPPNGESSPEFQRRCCAAFEQIVNDLMSTGQNTCAIMAHGGVIMFLLGTYGYPRQPFYEWITGNGMGYELILTPQMWINGQILEVAGRVPEESEEDNLAGLQDIIDDFKADL